MNKGELRQSILEKRKTMLHEDVEEKSKEINAKLILDKDYMKAKTVMFYVSKKNEVDTHLLIKEALMHKKVIVPKVMNDGLLCCEISDLNNMEFSCYGVQEPTDEVLCDMSEIDLIIVPGIVFDNKGFRIGYGKGFYDKLLKNSKCKKIGLAFDFQIVDELPRDEWDVKMDKVISDKI